MNRITFLPDGPRIRVLADGEEYFSARAATVRSRGVRSGDLLDDGQLCGFRRACLYADARKKAFQLLAIKDYPEKKLAEKICPDPEISGAVICELRELGLVNDERYAARRAEKLINEKLLSARAACAALAREGIDRETAESAVRALGPDPAESLRLLIEKKYLQKLKRENGPRLVAAALCRRGYSWNDVSSALREYCADPERE